MNTTEVIRRLRRVIRRQDKGLATEDNYVFWLRRFMAAVRQMPGSLASDRKLERFLSDLACRQPCFGEHAKSGARRDSVLLQARP